LGRRLHRAVGLVALCRAQGGGLALLTVPLSCAVTAMLINTASMKQRAPLCALLLAAGPETIRLDSASASTTASGCSSPRSVGDRDEGGLGKAVTFEVAAFPAPLRQKNTFLDFDLQASPAATIRRTAKSAPDLLLAALGELNSSEEDGGIIAKTSARKPCWADLLDDDAAASPAPPPPPPSAGSAGHEFGDCKPCAFVHKPRGCSLASSCPFCHICDSGEKRRRQREKKEIPLTSQREKKGVKYDILTELTR